MRNVTWNIRPRQKNEQRTCTRDDLLPTQRPRISFKPNVSFNHINHNSLVQYTEVSYTLDGARILKNCGLLILAFVQLISLLTLDILRLLAYVIIAALSNSLGFDDVEEWDYLLKPIDWHRLYRSIWNWGSSEADQQEAFQDVYSNLLDQNLILAMVHLIQCIAALIFYINKRDSVVKGRKLTVPQICWNHIADAEYDTFTPSQQEDDWTFYSVNVPGDTHVNAFIGINILVFFYLSFMFQFIIFLRKKSYFEFLSKDAVQIHRYVEYSLSASFMIMATLAAFGVTDAITITFAFFLTFACMLAGLVADQFSHLASQSKDDSRLNVWAVTSHVVSWIFFIVVWNLLRWTLLESTLVDKETRDARCNVPAGFSMWKFPDGLEPALIGILVIQLWLWAAFGVVQIRQFLERGTLSVVLPATKYRLQKYDTEKIDIAVRAERHFITLSMAAKSILAWILLTRVLIRN